MSAEQEHVVLITGAAGRVGSYLAADFAGRWSLRLSDRVAASVQVERDEPPAAAGNIIDADLCDLDQCRKLCRDVHTVVHLAADASPRAGWESLLPNNVVATHNLFAAAVAEGCRRVVYASSINAVRGYPQDVQVNTAMPTNPLNLYGATKVFGEAVGRAFHHSDGLSVICLRFGSVVDPRTLTGPPQPGWAGILSYRDLAQLVSRSIDAPAEVGYAILHGVSDNRFKKLDISDARSLLGYQPQDDAFAPEG